MASPVYTSRPPPSAPSRASRTPVSASCSVSSRDTEVLSHLSHSFSLGPAVCPAAGDSRVPRGSQTGPTLTELTERTAQVVRVCAVTGRTRGHGRAPRSALHSPGGRGRARPQVAPSGRGKGLLPTSPCDAGVVNLPSLAGTSPDVCLHLHVALPCPRVPPAGHRPGWTTASSSSSQPLTSAAHTRGAGG